MKKTDKKSKFAALISIVIATALICCSACSSGNNTAATAISKSDEITDLQMVLLNNISFDDRIETTGDLNSLVNEMYRPLVVGNELDGFKTVDFDHGDPTGFRAAAFKKGNSIVIVYCGTENGDLSDAFADAFSGLFDKSSQDDQAKQFARDNADAYPECYIYVTGYSLGGRLAYLGAEAIAEGERGSTSRIQKVVTFNGLGVKSPQKVEKHLKKIGPGNILNYIVKGDDISDDWVKKDHKMLHAGREIKFECTCPYDMGYPKLIGDLGIDVDLAKHDLYTFIDILGADSRNTAEQENEGGGDSASQEDTSDQAYPEDASDQADLDSDYDKSASSQDMEWQTFTYMQEDRDGYLVECSIKISPWIDDDHMDIVNDAWDEIANGKNFPGTVFRIDSNYEFYMNCSTGSTHIADICTDNIVYAVGQIEFNNRTEGFDITESSDPEAAIYLGINDWHSALTLSYSNEAKSYSVNANSFKADKVNSWYFIASGAINIEPKFTGNKWGPVPFVLAVSQKMTPNDPGGSPDIGALRLVIGPPNAVEGRIEDIQLQYID